MIRAKNQDRRNRDIFVKYKQLTEVKRLRFDDAISVVAKEFYLSDSSVIKIIRSMLQCGGDFHLPKPTFTGFQVRPKERAS